MSSPWYSTSARASAQRRYSGSLRLRPRPEPIRSSVPSARRRPRIARLWTMARTTRWSPVTTEGTPGPGPPCSALPSSTPGVPGDPRLGSPGVRAGPEENAPGVRVTGALAQLVSRAAPRRTHHLARRLPELNDGAGRVTGGRGWRHRGRVAERRRHGGIARIALPPSPARWSMTFPSHGISSSP